VLLRETFPRGERWHLAIHAFAGRNANQTLDLLVSHRMEGLDLGPLGFAATDYALVIWSLDRVADPAALLRIDGLRSNLEDWLARSALMKRAFRRVVTVAGLILCNLSGQRATGEQATFSSDKDTRRPDRCSDRCQSKRKPLPRIRELHRTERSEPVRRLRQSTACTTRCDDNRIGLKPPSTMIASMMRAIPAKNGSTILCTTRPMFFVCCRFWLTAWILGR
jgi:DEAD/H associated